LFGREYIPFDEIAYIGAHPAFADIIAKPDALVEACVIVNVDQVFVVEIGAHVDFDGKVADVGLMFQAQSEIKPLHVATSLH
jgi:hypothetical protein